MSYTSRQNAKDAEPVQQVADTATTAGFSDQRTSTAVQLQQQQMMRSASAPGHVVQQQGRVQATMQMKTDVKRKLDDATDTLTASKEIATPTEGTAWYRFAKDGKNIDTFSANRYSGLGTKGAANEVRKVDLKDSDEVDDPSEILDMGRPKHFAIADRMVGQANGSYREGKYTWHHMITPYKMQLVDMYSHGGFFHYGGMANWHDQDEGEDGDD